jgi:hypothetical protein
MNTPTSLTTRELSSIKRTLFEMLKSSGKLDEPDYNSLGESLAGLAFTHYSVNDYAIQLVDVIDGMVDLDDLAFDIDQLYHLQEKLK